MAQDSGNNEKSPDAFRTISEVSEILNVPQHVLRFWETRFSQVRPLKRGGNRRYYRPEDVNLLRAISHLLYVDGYTIKGVQKLLRENGIRATVADVLARTGMGDEEDGPDVLDLSLSVANPTPVAAETPAALGSGNAATAAPMDALVDELKAIRALLDQAAVKR
ncbi:MAG: hypothetical protein Tsb0016_12530 [Sphingomonadales bacterium]